MEGSTEFVVSEVEVVAVAVDDGMGIGADEEGGVVIVPCDREATRFVAASSVAVSTDVREDAHETPGLTLPDDDEFCCLLTKSL